MKRAHLVTALLMILWIAPAVGQGAPSQDNAPLFTSTPTIMIRSPNPDKLAQYYIALGFKPVHTSSTNGTTGFVIEGGVGVLEVLKMDKNTQPSRPKTSRTQQGVVAIYETTDQVALVARAKAAGAKFIEKWDSPESPISIYYIADPEYNILGFAPRHHNRNINTP